MNDLAKWRISALFHNGAYSTWAIEDLIASGTFGNSACMVEALHHEGGEWVFPRWNDEKHGASLYAYAGWWDAEYKSENHPDFGYAVKISGIT